MIQLADADTKLLAVRAEHCEVFVRGKRGKMRGQSGNFFQRFVADIPDHRIFGMVPILIKLLRQSGRLGKAVAFFGRLKLRHQRVCRIAERF